MLSYIFAELYYLWRNQNRMLILIIYRHEAELVSFFEFSDLNSPNGFVNMNFLLPTTAAAIELGLQVNFDEVIRIKDNLKICVTSVSRHLEDLVEDVVAKPIFAFARLLHDINILRSKYLILMRKKFS